jgi:hypothetical protein
MAGGRTGAAQGALNAGRDVLRAISGQSPVPLLTYNPGPGIYSRLERAIEAMPEAVRTQELPGLLKRYKDGVPGWELKATDLDSVIAGRDVVPREELLARVKERSPVYTHKEIVLGGSPQYVPDAFDTMAPEYKVSHVGEHPIGAGRPAGGPKYDVYGQGGEDYSEILLLQPSVQHHPGGFGSHWGGHPDVPKTNQAVAHARFDTHGDALRINELQSDLGIHNRKMREEAAQAAEILRERGAPLGALAQPNDLPFPLEDAWADLLIKRMALEAARKGHRAIEVASPRAIAGKVGGNIDNYEHFYGKVVPGALERLGRKMGGLVVDAPSTHSGWTLEPWDKELSPLRNQAMQAIPSRADGAYRNLVNSYITNEGPEVIAKRAAELAEMATPAYANDMPHMVFLAEREAAARRAWMEARREMQFSDGAPPPAKRYLMSDEMRRRIIQQGIGASVLAPLLMQDEE